MQCLHADPVVCAAMRLDLTEDEVIVMGLECERPYHDTTMLNDVDEQIEPMAVEAYSRLPYRCLAGR